MAYHAKKRLGQNFLKTDTIINSIIKQINPQTSDTIIEIGAGRGALTLPLAGSGADVIAVEFDRDLIGYLEKLLSKFENVELVHLDFLKYNPKATGFKLVGNLPYNISSPVIEWAVKNRENINSAYLMTQKEVAQRLAASPGCKDWSPLTIFTQLYFDVEICFDISPNHFFPVPKVTSSLFSLMPKASVEIKNPDKFEKVVRQSFTQRRKTLVNNLVPELISDSVTAIEILKKLGNDSKIRAEQMTTDDFLNLTDSLISSKLL